MKNSREIRKGIRENLERRDVTDDLSNFIEPVLEAIAQTQVLQATWLASDQWKH